MGKLKMKTKNLADENFALLARLFPNVITETVDKNGTVTRAIDADALAQEIKTHVIRGKDERYQFTWPDKKKSILLANASIAATLRPCREESVNFDTTQNLYIEGDNLDVLKLLREIYLNSVKMIYIDPPYNTGNDFIYEDNFSDNAKDFLIRDGQYDQDGNRMLKNLDSNGRFHTDWLNMIYPRLRVARDLLADDGVIFMSINDNEVENLKKICNEIFGEKNFVANLVWQSKYTVSNDAQYISYQHENILFYAKSLEKFNIGRLERTEEQNTSYKNRDNDLRGPWKATPLHAKSGTENSKYTITFDNGITWSAPPGRYPRYSKETLQKLYKQGEIYFNSNGGADKKTYLSDVSEKGLVCGSLLKYDEVGHTHANNEELAALIGKGMFDNPKGTKLLLRLLKLSNSIDSHIILDFFSGSATTAHAVMQLNAEDGGKRQFIMVQLPELTDESSEAFKAGYKNICEIGKERIRRAGIKIKETSPLTTKDLDIGFRVLKLDSSNMQDVYYTPQEYFQLDISGLMDNIKDDRTPEDLLFQTLLELGIPLSSKLEQKHIENKTIFYVNGNDLIACFEAVNAVIITQIAQSKPRYAVFRDISFATDSTLVNVEQIFKTYSPTTIWSVL
jgi:adenine-specific DNA-methyltransferase